MNKIIITACIALLFTISAFGQTTNFLNGYVVTIEGDTLYGTVKRFDVSSKNSFLAVFVDENGEKTKYKPKDLLAYQLGTSVYVRKKYQRPVVGAQPLIAFMKVMAEGTLVLYRYDYMLPSASMGPGSMGGVNTVQSSYYIEKSGHPLYLVKKMKFRKEITAFLPENETLVQRILAKELKYNNIHTIVNIYNNGMMKNSQ